MSEWEIPQYRPGQRIKLTDLSNDILTVLAECISEQKFASTQYLLSQCTPHLKQIAAPFLPLSYSDPEDQWPLSENTSLQQFLRSILARPDYARRIKIYKGNVIRFPEHTYNGDETLDVSMFTEVDWVRIRAAIKELEPDGEETTLWDIERGSWEAMTTLALSRLPYLEELEFQGWINCDDYVSSRSIISFVANAAKLQKEVQGPLLPLSVPLAHLTRVSLAYWNTEGGIGLDQLELFMQLKSVESISGHMILGEFYDPADSGFDPEDDLDNHRPLVTGESSFPHIREVDFNHSSIDYRVLEKFLSECPNIQKFRYDESGPVEGGAQFLPPRFMHALRQSQASLEELTIEVSRIACSSIVEQYPLGSFAEFLKLKTITLDAELLLGWVDPGYSFDNDQEDDRYPESLSLIAALPPNLERLAMKCDLASLTELLENIHDFPSLKHINFGWERIVYPDKPLARKPSKHLGFTSDEVDKILDLCDTAGVIMEMEAASPPWRTLYGYIENAKSEDIPALIAAGGNIFKPLRVEYPYTDWEKLCEQFQCNVKNGRRVVFVDFCDLI